MQPIISIVVAQAENGVIGCSDGLPWNIPDELKYFKNTTMGKPVIMGRKTYESLKGPLKNRTNIILTRGSYESEGVIVKKTLEEAIKTGIDEATRLGVGEVMIIGGSEIFKQSLPFANKIYLTRIHDNFDDRANAYFYLENEKNWKTITKREEHLRETTHDTEVLCEFMILERKKHGLVPNWLSSSIEKITGFIKAGHQTSVFASTN